MSRLRAYDFADVSRWSRTTIFSESLRGRPNSPEICWFAAKAESQFRATLTLIALEGWKLEHGALPERLEQLVGTYFDSLPIDPFMGRPFFYYPAGVPFDLRLCKVVSGLPDVPAGTPFLWSMVGPGREVSAFPFDVDLRHQVPHLREGILPTDLSRLRPEPNELMELGWPYVIP